MKKTIFVLLLVLTTVSVAAGEVSSVDEPSEVASSVQGPNLSVLNFWATWCVPCVAEMADLRMLSNHFGDRVNFVGISLDDAVPGDREKTRQKVEKFLALQKITYRNLYWIGSPDPLLRHFDLTGEIPVTLVFDSKGRELFRHEGIIEAEAFARRIEQTLERKP